MRKIEKKTMRYSAIDAYPSGTYREPYSNTDLLFNMLSEKEKQFLDKHNYTVLYFDGVEYIIFKEIHPLFNMLVLQIAVVGHRFDNSVRGIVDAMPDSKTIAIGAINALKPTVVKLINYYYK